MQGTPPPQKKSGKIFSGNFHVKFGNFSCKNHVKFGQHFSYIFFLANVVPPKVDWAPTPMNSTST